MWRVFSAFILLMVASACGNPQPVINSIDDLAMRANTFDDLAKWGFNSYDDLVRLGARDADDLLRVRVTNAYQLDKLGVNSVDDLAALGFRSEDDLSKFGLNSIDELSKIGINSVDNFGQTQTASPLGQTLSKIIYTGQIKSAMQISTNSMATRFQQRNIQISEEEMNNLKNFLKEIVCKSLTVALDEGFTPSKALITANIVERGIDTTQYPEYVDTVYGITQQLQTLRDAEGLPGAFRDALAFYCKAPELY